MQKAVAAISLTNGQYSATAMHHVYIAKCSIILAFKIGFYFLSLTGIISELLLQFGHVNRFFANVMNIHKNYGRVHEY